MNPPIWNLVISENNHLILQIADRTGTREEDLGNKEEAMEKLAGFLAEQDFGEVQ